MASQEDSGWNIQQSQESFQQLPLPGHGSVPSSPRTYPSTTAVTPRTGGTRNKKGFLSGEEKWEKMLLDILEDLLPSDKAVPPGKICHDYLFWKACLFNALCKCLLMAEYVARS